MGRRRSVFVYTEGMVVFGVGFCICFEVRVLGLRIGY